MLINGDPIPCLVHQNEDHAVNNPRSEDEQVHSEVENLLLPEAYGSEGSNGFDHEPRHAHQVEDFQQKATERSSIMSKMTRSAARSTKTLIQKLLIAPLCPNCRNTWVCNNLPNPCDEEPLKQQSREYFEFDPDQERLIPGADQTESNPLIERFGAEPNETQDQGGERHTQQLSGELGEAPTPVADKDNLAKETGSFGSSENCDRNLYQVREAKGALESLQSDQNSSTVSEESSDCPGPSEMESCPTCGKYMQLKEKTPDKKETMEVRRGICEENVVDVEMNRPRFKNVDLQMDGGEHQPINHDEMHEEGNRQDDDQG